MLSSSDSLTGDELKSQHSAPLLANDAENISNAEITREAKRCSKEAAVEERPVACAPVAVVTKEPHDPVVPGAAEDHPHISNVNEVYEGQQFDGLAEHSDFGEARQPAFTLRDFPTFSAAFFRRTRFPLSLNTGGPGVPAKQPEHLDDNSSSPDRQSMPSSSSDQTSSSSSAYREEAHPSTSPWNSACAEKKAQILFHRRLSDRFPCLLGLLGLLWMVYTSCDVIASLDLRRLDHGFDFRGAQCGVDVRNRGLVFWPVNPASGKIDPTAPTCVSSCPISGEIASFPMRRVWTETLPDGQTVTHVSVTMLNSTAYDTEVFSAAYCLPTERVTAEWLTRKLGLGEKLPLATRLVKSVKHGWLVVLAAGLASCLLCLAYLIATSRLAHLVSWFSAIAAPLVVACGSFGLLLSNDRYASFARVALDNAPLRPWVVGVAVAGLLLAVSLAVANTSLRRQTANSVALLQATSACLAANLPLLAIPFIATLAAIGLWALGTTVLVGLVTCRTLAPSPSIFTQESLHTGPEEGSTAVTSAVGVLHQFTFSNAAVFRACLWIASLLWLIGCIQASAQYCVSWHVALWYFSVPDLLGRRREFRRPPILPTIALLLRLHAGTQFLAGAFLSAGRATAVSAFALRRQLSALGKRIGRFHVMGGTLASLPLRKGIVTMLRSLEHKSQAWSHNGLVLAAMDSTDFLTACAAAHELIHQSPWGKGVLALSRLGTTSALSNSFGLAATIGTLSLIAAQQVHAFTDPGNHLFVDSSSALGLSCFGLALVITYLTVYCFSQWRASKAASCIARKICACS